MLKGKKILIGISGSIAAYKTIFLIRLLIREGAEVKVVMTPSAAHFVSPLVVSTLSKNEALTGLFDGNSWNNHVALGRWADLMLLAPLSCNTLAKMATGLCDNLLMAVYLSATCPVMVAPAMDEDMWHHPATRANLDKIRQYGNQVIPVGKGELASGLYGDGRMAEPETILEHIHRFFAGKALLAGKKVLVTAGPTYEAIDPVRFIGNHSSGKMGYALASAYAALGAAVHLVSGPTSLPAPGAPVAITRVTSAAEMYQAVMASVHEASIIVMAAAVADYTPAETAPQKIKKKDPNLTLQLVKTPDILASVGAIKQPGQLLVGFALETENEQANAVQKLKTKKADCIVLNSLNDPQAGFGFDTNQVTLFHKNGTEVALGLKPKNELALDIARLTAEWLQATEEKD